MATTTNTITVQTTVNAPAEKVWQFWTDAKHIVNWNSPSPDWHTPRAEHDVRPGGRFNFRMEARDGSMGFDFGGVYDVVEQNKYLEYTMDDGRKAQVSFKSENGQTNVVETFEAENINSIEQQQFGWQAILDSFKNYTETTN